MIFSMRQLDRTLGGDNMAALKSRQLGSDPNSVCTTCVVETAAHRGDTIFPCSRVCGQERQVQEYAHRA